MIHPADLGRQARAMACAAALVAALPGMADAATCLRGINLSGAEFGDVPGKLHFDYDYPSEATIRYFASTGMNAIRLPFRWERLQPTLGQALSEDELAVLDATVDTMKKAGLVVILDPHNFGYYAGKQIGSPDVSTQDFTDLWRRLAKHYKNDPAIVFSLMNEPYDIQAADWLTIANAGIAAIRKAGADNLILVPGTAYTGAHSWTSDLSVGNNGAVMGGVIDPLGRYAYDLHQYLDTDFSGRNAECSGTDRALAGIDNVTNWLKANGKRGFLGEFGVSEDPACLAAMQTMITHMNAAPEQWIGWTYWSAGDRWPADYVFTAQPTADGDRPQVTALKPLLSGPSNGKAECAAAVEGAP